MKTRLLALLFALAMLASVFALASCTKQPTTDDPSVPVNKDPSDADDLLTALEVVDCDNDVFKILWPEVHSDGHFVHNEISASEEESLGDIINSAVFKRTSKVEENYNIDIQSELVFCSTIGKNIREDHLKGNTSYDAVATNIKFLTTAAIEGALVDFNTTKYYDESQEWWDHEMMEDFSIGGARYFGAGDIIYSDNFYPYCFFVNFAYANNHQTAFGEDYSQDYFYDLVLNEEWTYSKMLEICKKVSASNNEQWDNTASYGVLVNANTARAIYYSFGNSVVTKDENGYPVWSMTVANTQGVLDRILELFAGSKNPSFNTDIGPNGEDHKMSGMSHAQTALAMFANNQALFYAEELIVSERIHNDANASSLNFGILPMPLGDSQEDYICIMNDSVVLAADSSHPDLDRVSLILSALGRASVNTVTTAFFQNVLTNRYVQDVESGEKPYEVLQIILNSAKSLDIAALLDWGGMMSGFKNLADKQSSDFSSLYAQNIDKANDELATFVKKLKFYQS